MTDDAAAAGPPHEAPKPPAAEAAAVTANGADGAAAAGKGGAAAPMMKDWPVLVDELDYDHDPSKRGDRGQQQLGGGATAAAAASDSSTSSSLLLPPPTARSALIKGSHDRIKNVIGPVDLREGITARPCPCCARYVEPCGGQDPATAGASASGQSHPQQQQPEDDHNLPGSLKSTGYTIREVLVQGWVHKKGTGMDLFGSRAWKPRWATLAVATVPGYDVDVPLLLIYWFSSSDKPSNAIVLADTVVMPVDRYKTEERVVQWNTYTFEIVHTARGGGGTADGGGSSSSDKTTRTFSVPERERSDWVLAINRALLDYEKRLNGHRSLLAAAEQKRARERVKSGPARREGGGARSPPPAGPADAPQVGGGGSGGEPPLSPRQRGGRAVPLSKPPLSPRRTSPPPGGGGPASPGTSGGRAASGGGAWRGPLPSSSGGAPTGVGGGAKAGAAPAPAQPPTSEIDGMRIDMPHLS